MITPNNMRDAIVFMEARWGHMAGKAWEGWEDYYADFEPYDNDDLAAALVAWFSGGNKFAPKPSELLAALIEKTYQRAPANPELRDPTTCEHPTPWAFSIEPDGRREVLCRYCHATWFSEHVMTAVEEAEYRLKQAEAGRGSVLPSPL